MEYCKHELLRSSCGDCTPRQGAVDPHARSNGGKGSSFASEVTNTVYALGHSYGLVPSGGSAWVFGTGSVLHHRRECNESSSTPDGRVLEVADPNGDLWRSVLEPQLLEAAQVIVNVAGRPVMKVCQVCALRPQNT